MQGRARQSRWNELFTNGFQTFDINPYGYRAKNNATLSFDQQVTEDFGVFALDRKDGSQHWQHEINRPGAPLKVGESYGDLMAGLYASWAILAALHKRSTTGVGSTQIGRAHV